MVNMVNLTACLHWHFVQCTIVSTYPHRAAKMAVEPFSNDTEYDVSKIKPCRLINEFQPTYGSKRNKEIISKENALVLFSSVVLS